MRLWEPAWRQLGVRPEELGIRVEEATLFGEHTGWRPLFSTAWRRPLWLPVVLEGAREVLAQQEQPGTFFTRLGYLEPRVPRIDLLGDPLKELPLPEDLWDELGVPKPENEELAEALGVFLWVVREIHAYYERELGERSVSLEEAREAMEELVRLLQEDGPWEEVEGRFHVWEELDLRPLYRLTGLLLFATQRLAELKVEGPVRWETPWGAIVIGTREAEEYTPELLVLDPGGDDTYRWTAFEGLVQVIVDREGDDRYFSDRLQGPGSVAPGVALLWDLEGKDRYEDALLGMGAALGGIGILWDEKGNDQYSGDFLAQGAGIAGIGILRDREGNDIYRALQMAQGFGGPRGTGILWDDSGNDLYSARGPLKYPSPQNPKKNVSLAQGAGYGWRADFLNRRSRSGGFGWLLDGGGEDRYEAEVFAQGVGYWYALGALMDLGGKDRYLGTWYVQGASAHFAVGFLWDRAGDDRYEAEQNMAMGAGHDFSIGYLLDEAGNDEYRGTNLSLGAGNANGGGLFLDVAGDDRYFCPERGTCLGEARTAARIGIRTRLLTWGLFLDRAGNDSYSRKGGNRKTWKAEGPAWGLGLDLPAQPAKEGP